MSAPASVSSAAAHGVQRESDTVQAVFFVTAAAEPNVAPRLIEPFAKLGIVPSRVSISGEVGDGCEITADLRADGVSRQCAHAIDKALRRIVGVRQVIALSE